jgi:hypothetical protein
MGSEVTAGLPLVAVGAALVQAAGALPVTRWLIVGALAIVALYLLVAAVRCALRIVGLAVLVVVAWLAWRWFT